MRVVVVVQERVEVRHREEDGAQPITEQNENLATAVNKSGWSRRKATPPKNWSKAKP